MFGAIFGAEGSTSDALIAVAREFSPRIDLCGPHEILLDLSGLARLFGDARTIAEELRRTAADRGLQIRVAIAATRTAARLMIRHRAGLTVIEPGTEAAALAALPLTLLGALTNDPHDKTDPNELITTFRRWGLRTLGDLAALPPDDVSARVGQAGVQWQHLARGEDEGPLVPAVPEERFEQALDLEWPIEELEPLAFALGRLLEPLEAHLERRGRGAAVLHVRLSLVKSAGAARQVHERTLQLPTPIRDARTLRTLALLDLESHPPGGPVDRVVVAVDPTPARIVQFSLITRPLPSPEQISTLMARLQALMGETRCGTPALVDSWRPEAFEMKPFAPVDTNVLHPHEPRPSTKAQGVLSNVEGRRRGGAEPRPVDVKDVTVVLRRFRHPVPARVRVADGKPARVTIDRRGMSGGGVTLCAGPWRTSGDWWRESWDRDEWDVTLSGGETYRLFRARDTEQWFVDGVVD